MRVAGGYEWSGDERHQQVLYEEWGLENANHVDLPLTAGLTDETTEEREKKEPMNITDAKKFRRAAARFNYMSQDRPDLAVLANRLSRLTATPRVGDDAWIKRGIRYLRGPCLDALFFPYQDQQAEITVETDSDWAGCRLTRKSTSGAIVRVGQHPLTFSCRLQKTLALSSGEAELCAQVGGISEALGIRNLFRDLGFELCIQSRCDSSAARGILQRAGAGRIRHLELRHLWVQDLVARGEAGIRWIPRSTNPADVLTHQCVRQDFGYKLKQMGCIVRSSYRACPRGDISSHPLSLIYSPSVPVAILAQDHTDSVREDCIVLAWVSRKRDHLHPPQLCMVAERSC